MKLKYISTGRALRIVRLVPKAGRVYVPSVVEAIKEKYGFVGAPNTIKEINDPDGLLFEHGKFTSKNRSGSEDIVISTLRLLNDGVMAETRAGVEYADEFIDQFLKWHNRKYKDNVVVYTSFQPQKGFLSELEVELNKPIDKCMTMLESLGGYLVKALESYGNKTEPFVCSGFTFHTDTTKIMAPLLPPLKFIIERRDGKPYESNTYFSSAPLTTSDHLSVLKKLEELVD